MRRDRCLVWTITPCSVYTTVANKNKRCCSSNVRFYHARDISNSNLSANVVTCPRTCSVMERAVSAFTPRTFSFWTRISGGTAGAAGSRPLLGYDMTLRTQEAATPPPPYGICAGREQLFKRARATPGPCWRKIAAGSTGLRGEYLNFTEFFAALLRGFLIERLFKYTLVRKNMYRTPDCFFWRAKARYRYGGRSEENVAWWEEEEDSRGDNNSSWFSGWASA